MEKFKEYCLLNNRSASTTRKHTRTLQLMEKRVGGLTAGLFQTYASKLIGTGCSPSYVNGILTSLRVYHHYLRATKQVYDKTVFSLRELKELPPLKAILSLEEVERLVNLQKPFNVKQKHWDTWSLFFEVLSLTGLRTGELAKMQVGNVNFGINCFEVLDDKTHQNRLVPIPPNLIDKLQLFIKGLAGNYLFPSERGGHRDNQPYFDNVDWHYNFHSRLKRLGIKRPGLTPYSLRHGFITTLLEEDVSIFKVQKIVGHRRLETTALYTHLTTKDIQKAVLKHPTIMKQTDPSTTLKALREMIQAFGLENNPKFHYTYKEDINSLRLEVKIKDWEHSDQLSS